MQTTGMSIEQWHEYAGKGADIPITIKLHGVSMEPLIRYERDPVTILPLKREPKVGDVVLFRRQDGAYVVHRVFRVGDGFVQTWGDNCASPDRPLRREDVLGIVIRVQRGRRAILLDTDRQRAYGIRWMRRGRKGWQAYRRLRATGGRAVRRVWPGFHRADRAD